jgi:hypothetical protein
MPTCVTGMPKSGLSMVAAGLEAAGVRVLAQDSGLAAITEAVLDAAGGAWDMPPDLTADWELSHAATAQRIRASSALRELDLGEPWAWVDPGAALVAPFWRGLLPTLQLVVCVRNPLEVARSLGGTRPLSDRLAAHLWRAHVRAATGGPAAAWPTVTHYESHLGDAEAEMRRVLQGAGVEPAPEALAAAAAVPSAERRHHAASAEDTVAWADAETVELYLRACAESGPQLHAALAGAAGEDGQIEALALQRELTALRRARADAEDAAEEVRRELADTAKRHTRRVQLLRRGREKARDDAARRAAEFEQQLATMRDERDQARAETQEVIKRRDTLRRELDALKAAAKAAPAVAARPAPAPRPVAPPPTPPAVPAPAPAPAGELVKYSATEAAARRTWRALPRPAKKLLEPAADRVRRRLQAR